MLILFILRDILTKKIRPSKLPKDELSLLDDFQLEPPQQDARQYSNSDTLQSIRRFEDDDFEISEENNKLKLPSQNDYFINKKKGALRVSAAEDRSKGDELDQIGQIFNQLDIREKSQTTCEDYSTKAKCLKNAITR